MFFQEIQFQYVDVWSSKFTWGNKDPPTKGDMVVISKGQSVLLDVSTPILRLLLIKGGTLTFDRKDDIELHAEAILITEGGTLQVRIQNGSSQYKLRCFKTNILIHACHAVYYFERMS